MKTLQSQRTFLLCVCVCVCLAVASRPACSSADTEALSQGCSSALLFRDNDKALNPSVDLTFVPLLYF